MNENNSWAEICKAAHEVHVREGIDTEILEGIIKDLHISEPEGESQLFKGITPPGWKGCPSVGADLQLIRTQLYRLADMLKLWPKGSKELNYLGSNLVPIFYTLVRSTNALINKLSPKNKKDEDKR